MIFRPTAALINGSLRMSAGYMWIPKYKFVACMLNVLVSIQSYKTLK